LSFEELNLSPEVLSGLNDVKFDEPTPLQKSLIPVALEGKDVIVKAHSGMGKNGSFIIPVLENFNKSEKKGTRALILTPSVEGAKSIDEKIWAMGYHAQIECAPIDMRGDWDEQEQALKAETPVIVANPGRLIDLLSKNRMIFKNLELLVIDEADDMHEMGILPKVQDILKRIMSDPQMFFYADKINDDLEKFAKKHLKKDAVYIGFDVFDDGDKSQNNGQAKSQKKQQKKKDSKPQQDKKEKAQSGHSNGQSDKIPKDLKQGYIYIPGRLKISTLMTHLGKTPTDSVIIFTASKRGTDRLYRIFRKNHKKVTSIHGKLSDGKRNERFSKFKKGNYQYLLVADISAGDLDLDHVMQVINYDVPNDIDEYKKRIGLVGSGKATRIISLVSKQDRKDINAIEKELDIAPEEIPLPNEVKKKKKQKNRKRGRNKNRGRGRGRGRKNGRHGKRGRRNKKRSRSSEYELPRPSYDKLSGGKSGEKKKEKESKGIIGFVKKLFS